MFRSGKDRSLFSRRSRCGLVAAGTLLVAGLLATGLVAPAGASGSFGSGGFGGFEFGSSGGFEFGSGSGSLDPGSSGSLDPASSSPVDPILSAVDDKSKACDSGNTAFAYNSLATGALNCYGPSLGFQAQRVNEYGDAVGLAGTARGLVSLDVLFASWACSVSGAWSTGDCVSNPGDTFNVPITARIYAADNLATPLAVVTKTAAIPYRPSADNVNCTGAFAGRRFNADGAQGVSGSQPSGGRCQSSIGAVVNFPFPAGTTLPDRVVWTVAYNTTSFGDSPIGTSAPCFSTSVGCPYDGLNVGATDFPNAPYSGTNLLPVGEAYSSQGQPSAPLATFSSNKPLGAIATR
ncbi:hypothetical protein [Rhodococcus sp. ARC_M6]|uniref:hypothetical protein n=1 Tax=Rhodococcus sp. ARC_M6 TaxID=2928852 RepID=UPI001FB4217F|nr:hypothetical protein [Rhodococcus sp. ARC_M6]MCJ0904778.1 hypothetical protein [Rhodococcus sp. ARC_M6]